MKKIIEGLQGFQKEVFTAKKKVYEDLVKGQHPLALFITCSDSRILPNTLTQTEPGELFVIRNAGNLVPPYEDMVGGEAGTIEYAVSALGIRDIVVCGHSHCGAMAGLLNPDALETLPAVKEWLKQAESTSRSVREKLAEVTDPAERLASTVELNVLAQLEHLRSHPSVAAALSRGELNLHGWVYQFETGQVLAHNPETSRFEPLTDTSPWD